MRSCSRCVQEDGQVDDCHKPCIASSPRRHVHNRCFRTKAGPISSHAQFHHMAKLPLHHRPTMFAPTPSLLRHLRHALQKTAQASRTSNGTYIQCAAAAAAAAAAFSTSAHSRSGHSKWATIKHDKARADAKKNKQRSMLAQQIELVSRCMCLL